MGVEESILVNLKTLNKYHESLEKQLFEKQQAVMERNIERLEILNRSTAEITDEIKQLHKRRKQLWGKLIVGEKYPTAELLLSELSGNIVEEVEELVGVLRQRMEKIQFLSAEISESLTDRLDGYNKIFTSLFESLDDHPEVQTYDGQGKQDKTQQKPSVVIDEAV